jgi:hypothetical protein
MFERLREFLNFPQKRALHMLPAQRAGARVAWALRRSGVRYLYNEKTLEAKGARGQRHNHQNKA